MATARQMINLARSFQEMLFGPRSTRAANTRNPILGFFSLKHFGRR